MPQFSGYCYEADHIEGQWETVVYTFTAADTFEGIVSVDGTKCAVYLCRDSMFRAVSVVNVYVRPDVDRPLKEGLK